MTITIPQDNSPDFLARQWAGLIPYAIKRWASDGAADDDLRGELWLAMAKAIARYDSSRGAFNTHALWWLRSGVGEWRRKRNRRLRLPITNLTDYEATGEAWGYENNHMDGARGSSASLTRSVEHQEAITTLLSRVRKHLSDQAWTILTLIYHYGYSVGRIVKLLGISKQRVHQILEVVRAAGKKMKGCREEAVELLGAV